MEPTNNQQNTNPPSTPTQTPAPEPVVTQAPVTDTAESTPKAPKNNTTMAILAYIGPLVIVSYLTAKDDSFVKFHIKQGLVLFVAEIALWFIGTMVHMLWPVINVIHIAIIVFAVVGIINANKGKEKELPFIGKFGASFNI